MHLVPFTGESRDWVFTDHTHLSDEPTRPQYRFISISDD
jgi:hypothetical protein